MARIPPTSLLARTGALALMVAAVFACANASGASSSTVVGATVPSATSISVTGCLPGVAGRTAFGAVAAESSNVTTSDCTLGFGSTNDTASLRVAQLDGTGAAMAAVPDRLQSSFGTNGISTLASGVAGMNSYGAMTSIMQPDGKVVGAGSAYLGGQVQSIVYRRNADGSLDTAGFNAPLGYVAFDTAVGQNEDLRGIDLQPDGRIVVVGWTRTGGTDNDGTIARVGSDGKLDTAFGGGGTGWRVVDLGGTAGGEAYKDVAVEASGTIVAVGQNDTPTIDDQWVLDRYSSLGSPDPGTGGGTGRVVVNPSANNDTVRTITPHPAGGFLVGGRSQPGTYVGHVMRVDGALAPVTSWGVNGHRTLDIVSYYEDVIEIEPLADGSALVAIDQQGGIVNRAIVARLTPGGALDTAGFAAPAGFAQLPSTADMDSTFGIEVAQPSGYVYVAFMDSSANTRVGRLTPLGIVDTSFGSGGVSAPIAVRNPAYRGLHLVGGSAVLVASNPATVNDSMVRLGGVEVDDYRNVGDGTDRDWSSGTSTNLFGACLRAVGAAATADWTVDPDADCTIDDADPWRAVPPLTSDAAAKVAHTTASGQSATAMLRFAFRPSRTLPSGAYEAPLAVEVVAPQA